MTLADRLKAMLEERGYSQGELARRVGVTQGTVYKLVSGQAKSSKRLVEIAEALNVNAHWLLTGNGFQYVEQSTELNHTAGRNESGLTPETLELHGGVSLTLAGEIAIPLLPDIESAFANSPFPFTAYSGLKMTLSEADLKTFGVDVDKGDFIGFSVKDDSMAPVMPIGTRVVVDLNDKQIIDGKFYAIDQGNWKKIRALYRSGSSELTMRTYNQALYPEEKIGMDDLQILGRIVFSQRGM
ncbi:helix-turn-helix transcriptional regulator [Pantoea sp. Al-1710]|uniref:Helix-turn-helix transcriptional regulator n=1 Tax=Candidatus Pantoea communis TaxID=2608354 RepID=A0ABX0RJQ0_9GAMM|nr:MULTISPECIES: helix-turn-helix domain-containing protein [Pantoea]NIG12970.1 helix-turn-helix transcriptional regulator [Pantoea sp. Cy-640]NIG17329.1 helix-turn-helix transcriptional regulator [Pantoea communis]